MFPYESIDDLNKREETLDKLKDTWKEYEYFVNEKSSSVNLYDKYNKNALKRIFDTKHTNKYKRRYKRR